MTSHFIRNNRIQLALASIMFFSLLVKKDIIKGQINSQDANIINKYIKLGDINMILLVSTIITGIIAYFGGNNVIDLIYRIVLWGLTGLTICEALFITTVLSHKKDLS